MGDKNAIVRLVQRQALSCLEVWHPNGQALIALQGAQVLSYQPQGAAPVIWLSEQAAFARGKSVRGGIPLCWPWFGELARNPPAVMHAFENAPPPLPAHGWVRDRPWLLDQVEVTEDGVELVLSYPFAGAWHPAWPHPVALEVRYRIGARLEIQLVTRNTGPDVFVFTQALHSYFAVSDIRHIEVHGLQGCDYTDTLQHWQRATQAGPVRFDGETDRIYHQVPARLSILDPGARRRIWLEASGSRSCVVWNPWIDKAQRLSQFATDAWQRMLCIETANVLEDSIRLEPGASHQLTLVIGTEALV